MLGRSCLLRRASADEVRMLLLPRSASAAATGVDSTIRMADVALPVMLWAGVRATVRDRGAGAGSHVVPIAYSDRRPADEQRYVLTTDDNGRSQEVRADAA